MDTAVTRVERTESRNTAITSTANARPSRPSWNSVSMDCWMNGAWSNTTVRSAPPPTRDASSGRASRTACETATRSASGVAVTETDSVGTPSVRVRDVGAAATRVTSATSSRVRGSPSPEGATTIPRRPSRSSTAAPAWTG